MQGLMQGIAFLPFVLVVWSSAAFIISYVTAVIMGHVQPLVPYISDTGTHPPESAIFGFMISITSFWGALTMYAKYKILQKQHELSSFLPPYINILSLCVGLLGCIGMCIVATFQELTIPLIHDIGALLTFISGVVYILLQSIVSYIASPMWSTRRVSHIRAAITFVSLLALIPMIICGTVILITNHSWDTDMEESKTYMASAICEWIVAFGFVFYFLTYIQEFQAAKLKIATEVSSGYR